jgi:hypothetical protein
VEEVEDVTTRMIGLMFALAVISAVIVPVADAMPRLFG